MQRQTLETDYAGKRRWLFWLALKSSALTVLTVGVYRFWMKTRLRRFYWSAIRPGGLPLEYTGTGVEKLMGFLVAVVVMAFYIGIVNLILVFLSFSLLNGNFAAYVASFVGVIPIYFFATYRARHYVLARTRWRGVRFGIERGAWPYAWRAMLHWLATILTLGVLLPRQVFWLEKYRIDRTWFGRARFHQGGRWTMLVPAARQMYIGLAISAIAGVAAIFDTAALGMLAAGVIWAALGLVHFRVQSFRLLAAHKRLGDGIRFSANPRSARIIGIYIFGFLLVGLTLFLVLVGLVAAVVTVVYLVGDPLGLGNVDFARILSGQSQGLAGYIVIALGAGVYFSVFILWGVLRQVFVTLPVLRHYSRTVRIIGSHHLPMIGQRPRDAFTEAEGFAEALDIGAAI